MLRRLCFLLSSFRNGNIRIEERISMMIFSGSFCLNSLSIIRNAHVLNQLFFDSVVGTDIKNLIPSFLQSRYQRDVRCYMTRCSAACKYNTLHTFSPVPDSFRADTRPPFSGFSDAANLNSVYATGLKSQVCCSYRKLLSASRRVSPLLKGTAMPGFRSTSFRKVPFREFKSRIR